MTLPPLLIWFGVGMALATVSVWAAAEPGPDGPVRRFCRSVAASPGMCALIAGCAFAIACTPVAGPQFTNFVSGLWPTEIKTALYTIMAAAVVAPVAFRPSGPAGPPYRGPRGCSAAGCPGSWGRSPTGSSSGSSSRPMRSSPSFT